MSLRVGFFISCLALLQGCETVPAASEVVIAADTVLVLPVESVYSELATSGIDIQQHLSVAIGKQDFKVTSLSQADYQQLRSEALVVSGSMYEPRTGQLKPLNRNSYTKAIIDLTREKQHFDVIVLAEIVLRSASVEGDDAVWDGVRREFSWVKKPKVTYTLPDKGSGLSLRLDAYTDHGNKLFSNFAGISLPYDLRYEQGKFIFVLKSELFTPEEMEKSIASSMKIFNQKVKYDDN